MHVNALDHVNISTQDVASSARFFSELLNLDVRNGPGTLPSELALWLYDRNERAIIHLVKRDVSTTATGPIHHVAFNCSGKQEMLERLRERGAEFSIHEHTVLKLTQIFTHDPHGILLELNFHDD